jgi:hypothetical protein
MEHQLDATITVLLIFKINKTVIVASSWCSIFTYLPTLMMHGQTQIKSKLLFLLITNLTHFSRCIYLFPFSACFEQPSAHHQENQLYQYVIWYILHRSSLTCIPDGHLNTVIYTRWCIDTIDSPDDEHWVARNMERREINKYIEKSASSWLLTRIVSGSGGLEVACWPLEHKVAGSNPAEAVGFFRTKKSSARLPSEGQ